MASKSQTSGEEPDLDEVLGELEKKMDRLKVLYEQYFMGIERIEPQTAWKEVTRKMLELTQLNRSATSCRTSSRRRRARASSAFSSGSRTSTPSP